MVIPAAGRAYNIPSARDPKRWNLSIFLGNQPWGPTWLCILYFSLKVGYFDFVKNILNMEEKRWWKSWWRTKLQQQNFLPQFSTPNRISPINRGEQQKIFHQFSLHQNFCHQMKKRCTELAQHEYGQA